MPRKINPIVWVNGFSSFAHLSGVVYVKLGCPKGKEHSMQRALPIVLLSFVFLPCGVALGQGQFWRGDANKDGAIDLSDAINILGYEFLGNPATLPCLDAADANDSGELDIA